MTKQSKPAFIIKGNTPLHGSVRVGGAKNASYKLMIASLLASSECRLLNLPNSADVDMVKKIINELGARAYSAGEHTLFIDPQNFRFSRVDGQYGKRSRASSLFLPVLLAKFGEGAIPLPGGDQIGKRPLDRHMQGLEKMGVNFSQDGEMLLAKINGNGPNRRLKACHYKFEKNTHTGTETLIMAAVLAKGKTVLENAALEPEIDDLITFLNAMGAKIRRRSFRKIEIEGVERLNGAIHRVMPDRNEAVSYACAAIITKGDIVVENAQHQDLTAFLEKLDEVGAGYEIGTYGIRFYYKGALQATDIETEIHPGFMTDWQPLFATLLCCSHGESIIHETVMQSRFQYVEHLKQMGAKIEYFNPEVKHPEKTYNFNWSDNQPEDYHAIKITGPCDFKAGQFEVHDLRAGATIMLAAIAAKGETVLTNIEQIERGYQSIEQKLISMGAVIERK
jgi:UDP-N-acetylglucosamine 1-carboxyvinyltransferase